MGCEATHGDQSGLPAKASWSSVVLTDRLPDWPGGRPARAPRRSGPGRRLGVRSTAPLRGPASRLSRGRGRCLLLEPIVETDLGEARGVAGNERALVHFDA